MNMKNYLGKKDIAFILGIFIVSICIILIGRLASKPYFFEIAIVVLFAITMTILLYIFRVFLAISNKRSYQWSHHLSSLPERMDALFSIYSFLEIQQPLPRFDMWAISPDAISFLISIIDRNRPNRILEIGSGVSTLLMGYCLKKLSQGKITSLEHDSKHAQVTRENVARHGLEDYIEVIHAPLSEVFIDGKKWLWYDITKIEPVEPIDILFVDGPPYETQRLARYPAMPILHSHLNEKATIILDDAKRVDEKEVVNLWLERFDDLESNYVSTTRGLFILYKGN